MNTPKLHIKANKEHILLVIILLISATSRLIRLSTWPDGAYPDEAYAAYNAYGLLTEGIDTWGYHFPVYFIAWGSGMNVAYSYLSIPFIYFLGPTMLAIRLPQAIISILGVYAMYVIGKECFSKTTGLFLAFILAINPWSILNARFGLESTLAPNMFLLAFCFLILSIKKKNSYVLLSAFLFGITLYCYAIAWIIVPIFLFFTFIIFIKHFIKDGYTPWAILILFVLALPLLLFLAINLGFLPEIKTNYFSIPKLLSFRGDELQLSSLLSNIKSTLKIILMQHDNANHTSSELVGAYYFFTTPLFIFGIFYHIKELFIQFKHRKVQVDILWFFWLIAAGIICIINSITTMIHINFIHIPLIFYSGYGIIKLGKLASNKHIATLCAVFFSFSFIIFTYDYHTEDSSYFFGTKSFEAIEAAKELANENETIYFYLLPTFKYSNLLWYELPPISDVYQNIEYGYTEALGWQEMSYYNGFGYIVDIEEATDEGIYILDNQFIERFYMLDYHILTVNEKYSLAYK